MPYACCTSVCQTLRQFASPSVTHGIVILLKRKKAILRNQKCMRYVFFSSEICLTPRGSHRSQTGHPANITYHKFVFDKSSINYWQTCWIVQSPLAPKMRFDVLLQVSLELLDILVILSVSLVFKAVLLNDSLWLILICLPVYPSVCLSVRLAQNSNHWKVIKRSILVKVLISCTKCITNVTICLFLDWSVLDIETVT